MHTQCEWPPVCFSYVSGYPNMSDYFCTLVSESVLMAEMNGIVCKGREWCWWDLGQETKTYRRCRWIYTGRPVWGDKEIAIKTCSYEQNTFSINKNRSRLITQTVKGSICARQPRVPSVLFLFIYFVLIRRQTVVNMSYWHEYYLRENTTFLSQTINHLHFSLFTTTIPHCLLG
jgi:hypothetical protein